jgi:hypothetical protein
VLAVGALFDMPSCSAPIRTLRIPKQPTKASWITILLTLTMTTQTKWGAADDAKLAHLFRKGPKNGGVETGDLGVPYVKTVHSKHFPARNYTNFAPLFRKKARAWNIEQSLQGSRRGPQASKY